MLAKPKDNQTLLLQLFIGQVGNVQKKLRESKKKLLCKNCSKNVKCRNRHEVCKSINIRLLVKNRYAQNQNIQLEIVTLFLKIN